MRIPDSRLGWLTVWPIPRFDSWSCLFIIIPSVNCGIHDLYRKFLAVTLVGPEFVADRIGRLGRKELGRVECRPGGSIVESLPSDKRLGRES